MGRNPNTDEPTTQSDPSPNPPRPNLTPLTYPALTRSSPSPNTGPTQNPAGLTPNLAQDQNQSKPNRQAFWSTSPLPAHQHTRRPNLHRPTRPPACTPARSREARQRQPNRAHPSTDELACMLLSPLSHCHPGPTCQGTIPLSPTSLRDRPALLFARRRHLHLLPRSAIPESRQADETAAPPFHLGPCRAPWKP